VQRPLPSYGKRLRRASTIEYKAWWSGYRIILAISGLLPPLVMLLLRHLYSMLSFSEVIESGLVGVVVTVAGTYLHSRRKGAEALDAQWGQKSGQQEAELAGKRLQIKSLQAEVNELKIPKRTPRQVKDYEEVSAILKDADVKEITILDHLRKVEKMSKSDQSGLGPLPSNFDRQQAEYALIGLVGKRLVVCDHLDLSGRWEVRWRIADWAKPHVEELL